MLVRALSSHALCLVMTTCPFLSRADLHHPTDSRGHCYSRIYPLRFGPQRRGKRSFRNSPRDSAISPARGDDLSVIAAYPAVFPILYDLQSRSPYIPDPAPDSPPRANFAFVRSYTQSQFDFTQYFSTLLIGPLSLIVFLSSRSGTLSFF